MFRSKSFGKIGVTMGSSIFKKEVTERTLFFSLAWKYCPNLEFVDDKPEACSLFAHLVCHRECRYYIGRICTFHIFSCSLKKKIKKKPNIKIYSESIRVPLSLEKVVRK